MREYVKSQGTTSDSVVNISLNNNMRQSLHNLRQIELTHSITSPAKIKHLANINESPYHSIECKANEDDSINVNHRLKTAPQDIYQSNQGVFKHANSQKSLMNTSEKLVDGPVAANKSTHESLDEELLNNDNTLDMKEEGTKKVSVQSKRISVDNHFREIRVSSEAGSLEQDDPTRLYFKQLYAVNKNRPSIE